MNTNIKCLRVISIVIMAALVCAVLTGCKESGGENDPREPFFGTWSDNNGRTLTISKNTIRMDFSDGKYWVAEPIWTPITNTSRTFTNTYPNGYNFGGSLIIESNYESNESLPVYFPFFMHNDKQSFIVIFDPVSSLTFYKK